MLRFVTDFHHIKGDSWCDHYQVFTESFIKSIDNVEVIPVLIGENVDKEDRRLQQDDSFDIIDPNLNDNHQCVGAKFGKEEAQEILDKEILKLKTQARNFANKVVTTWRKNNLDFNITHCTEDEIKLKESMNMYKLKELRSIKNQLAIECDIFMEQNIDNVYTEVTNLWIRFCPGDYSRVLDINYTPLEYNIL